MNTIIIDTDKMQATADQLHVLAGEGSSLQSSISELDNGVYSSLASVWQGEDATKYINAFHEKLITNLIKVNENIEKTADNLLQIKNLYDDLDSEFAAKKCGLI